MKTCKIYWKKELPKLTATTISPSTLTLISLIALGNAKVLIKLPFAKFHTFTARSNPHVARMPLMPPRETAVLVTDKL